MDRLTFLQTLARLGIPDISLHSIEIATAAEVDEVWKIALKKYLIFEVGSEKTLSLANFEEPANRWEAYGYSKVSDLTPDHIENHGSLCEEIKELYRMILTSKGVPAIDYSVIDVLEDERIDVLVEEAWYDWVSNATGDDRKKIDEVIKIWLDDEPDWADESEAEYLYQTGSAQGIAYDYFVNQDFDFAEALGVVVIEGEHPGSSYYAAELRVLPDEANRVAIENGWEVRFIQEVKCST